MLFNHINPNNQTSIFIAKRKCYLFAIKILIGIACVGWLSCQSLISLPLEVQEMSIRSMSMFSRDGVIENLADVLSSLINMIKMIRALFVGLIVIGGTSLNVLYRIDTRLPSERYVAEKLKFGGIDVLILLSLVLIFSGLVAVHLNDSFWWDEAWTMKFVEGTWAKVFSPDDGNNHLLMTLLIKVTIGLFKSLPVELAARIPSLIFSILSISGIYCLAKNIKLSRGYACVASILTLSSYGFIWAAINARGYAAVIACSIWAAILVTRLDSNERFPIKRFVSLGLVSFLTIPTGLVLIISFFGVLLIRAQIKKEIYCGNDLIEAIKGAIVIVILGSAAYAWSLPSRLLYIANRNSFSIDQFVRLFYWASFWLGPAKNIIWGGIIFFIITLSLHRLLKVNKNISIYLFLVILFSLGAHFRGGYNSYWYSSYGLVFIPLLATKVAYDFFYSNNKKTIFIGGLVSFLLITNLQSLSLLNGKRAWGREISESIELYLRDHPNRKIAVIRAIPTIDYYLRKQQGIQCDRYKSLKDYQERSGFDEGIIIAHDSITLSQAFKQNIRTYRGWADSFNVVINN